MLLAAGATLDAKDANGSTAAQLAEYWYGISVIVISSSSCMTCMIDRDNISGFDKLTIVEPHGISSSFGRASRSSDSISYPPVVL